MKYTEEQVFYKGGTAALFVMSPFQLLCAREAVHEFEFDEYKYVFVLSPSIPTRNEQMVRMAKEWEIDYDSFDSTAIRFDDFTHNKGIFDIKNKLCKFDRIFIGDYGSPECRMLAKKYAKDNAVISFVDDGTASIYVLNNQFCCGPKSDAWADMIQWSHLKYGTKRNLKMINRELLRSGIFVTDSLYSVYSDVEPTRFLTRQNRFKVILENDIKCVEDTKSVYFIGSPSEDFCKMYGISINYLNEIILTQLTEVRKRFTDTRILYIPHPRDNNQEIKEYCKALDIDYKSLCQPAEDYIRSRHTSVVAVYGFGSSTLINLKRMYPAMQIFDVIIENPHQRHQNKMTEVINNYYEQNGIKTIKILITNEHNLLKPISLKENISGLINYFTKGVIKL